LNNLAAKNLGIRQFRDTPNPGYAIFTTQILSTATIQSTVISPAFVDDFTAEDQFLNKPTSHNSPWTPLERFQRNDLGEYDIEDDIGVIGQSENGDQLQVRSLMIDIARNFHSLETIKVSFLRELLKLLIKC